MKNFKANQKIIKNGKQPKNEEKKSEEIEKKNKRKIDLIEKNSFDTSLNENNNRKKEEIVKNLNERILYLQNYEKLAQFNNILEKVSFKKKEKKFH